MPPVALWVTKEKELVRVIISVPDFPLREQSARYSSSSDKVLVWIRIRARNNTLMI